ncbi:MAG: hypothetical protein AB8B60_16645 [Sulfitobacter sp.]
MNIWSTFRHVPPISPQAMAWATLSFATFLGATEFGPIVAGRPLDPLALALAVQLTLSFTKNMTSDRFARAFVRSPRFCVVLASSASAGLAAMALYAEAAFAAKLFIFYYLTHAALLSFFATHYPEGLDFSQGSWTDRRLHREAAVMLEAAGIVIAAATLFTVWTFADPLAFAAMMSFGVLIVRMMANWVIVLYLLDQQNRAPDRRDD